MKIGNLHITWMSEKSERDVRQIARNFLVGPDGREIVARMARSEMKNYLAECAERAHIPFISAESLLARLEERALLLEAEADALGAMSSKMREQFDLEDDFIEVQRPGEKM